MSPDAPAVVEKPPQQTTTEAPPSGAAEPIENAPEVSTVGPDSKPEKGQLQIFDPENVIPPKETEQIAEMGANPDIDDPVRRRVLGLLAGEAKGQAELGKLLAKQRELGQHVGQKEIQKWQEKLVKRQTLFNKEVAKLKLSDNPEHRALGYDIEINSLRGSVLILESEMLQTGLQLAEKDITPAMKEHYSEQLKKQTNKRETLQEEIKKRQEERTKDEKIAALTDQVSSIARAVAGDDLTPEQAQSVEQNPMKFIQETFINVFSDPAHAKEKMDALAKSLEERGVDTKEFKEISKLTELDDRTAKEKNIQKAKVGLLLVGALAALAALFAWRAVKTESVSQGQH